jgi:uncharacterized protein (TIGR00251 family)
MADTEPRWLTESAGRTVLTLRLHVQPGAKRTEPVGAHGDRLKLRLAAPPVDGKANAELRAYLAKAFGVPLRNVELLAGGAGRQKTVRVSAPVLRPDRGWAG